MLTKNLVRHRKRGERIYPTFIDPSDAGLLEAAQSLITIFEEQIGQSRETLLSLTETVMEGRSENQLVLKGFEKLMLDRCEFERGENEAQMEMRSSLFLQSSNLLSAAKESYSEQDYHHQLMAESERSLAELQEQLYADLPDCQPLKRVKKISPQHFLHRYNAAQVQGLLLHSQRLRIYLQESETGSLRQLFKYLRFHQLLADIMSEGSGHFTITIDGPLSLFYQTKKYGLNLATFFPALLHQKKWKLDAEIQFKGGKSYQLLLDQSCGILPYQQRYLNYIPPEISIFESAFNGKYPNWEISSKAQFLPLGGDQYCFPDFQLCSLGGKCLGIELFHPWHAGQLKARLKQLADVAIPPLLLGVSTRLSKDKNLAPLLAESAYFGLYGFTFRDIPSPGKLGGILGRLEAVL